MLYIIIAVHNRKDFTRNCLLSLQKQTYRDFKVIVIDDGSVDGTSEMIQNEFSDSVVLFGDGNLWWTGATNFGLEYIDKLIQQNDYILTLNNDLTVDRNYLYSLISVSEKYKPCIVGSVSVADENRELIDFAGIKWNKYSGKRTANFKKDTKYSQISSQEIIHSDLLPGRGTLIPAECFKKIGFYDQKHFPHYAADEDYSLRAEKSGYKLLISTNAVVYSNINNTGLNYKLQKPTIKLFIKSLTSIKSAINIKSRFFWAIKNSPIGIIYFLIDFSRICISFAIQFIKIQFFKK